MLPTWKNRFVLESHQKLFAPPLGLTNVERTASLDRASEGYRLW
jgi:hypothetical protein